MSWKTIIIFTQSDLSFKDNQLICESKDTGKKTEIPLEDIDSIILDTQQVNITGYLLSQLAENKISLFTTNFSHMPNGIFLPYMSYYKNSEIAFLQQKWSIPFKKKLWKKIIQQKTQNQAYFIKKYNLDTYKKIIKLSKGILSGDRTNIEGRIANEYWKAYQTNFIRHSNTKINSALNYGYSIIRGLLAKNIVSCGFITCFGIHHCSSENSFNLIDDLIEPFRPFVDNLVKKMYKEDSNNYDLDFVEKRQLLTILQYEIEFDNECYSILDAIKLFSKNFLRVTKSQKVSELILPTFIKEL